MAETEVESILREIRERVLSEERTGGERSAHRPAPTNGGNGARDAAELQQTAGNNHAARMLVRDVDNLRRFFGRAAPSLLETDYGKEIWALYETGALAADVALTGRFEQDERVVDLEAVMREIDDARLEDEARRMRLQALV